MARHRTQALLFILLTWLFVTPQLWRSGTNIVTDTYARAAAHFWAGENVYTAPQGRGDWFKYSPFFAGVYGIFTLGSSPVQALLWALCCLSFFWLGISRWFVFGKESSGWMWLALLFCSIEADICTRYQQVNTMMVGLVLWALAEAREGRLARSGGALALATNLKVLPVFFAIPLFYPWNRRYGLGFFAVTLALIVVPALWLGWSGMLQAHYEWYRVLTRDMDTRGLLDLQTVLMQLGLKGLGANVRWTLLTLTLTLLIWMRRPAAWSDWGNWYTLAATTALLFNPRTESPTFVLLGPSYLFLMRDALHQNGLRRYAGYLFVTVVGFGVSLSFSDLWPKSIWDPRASGYIVKTLGCLLLWAWAFARALKRG